jgi:putative SOS response-associated peptidase YedK
MRPSNIRNTSSPHWRMWLRPENRWLVPANDFAEYAPEPNPEDVVWFALNEAHRYQCMYFIFDAQFFMPETRGRSLEA